MALYNVQKFELIWFNNIQIFVDILSNMVHINFSQRFLYFDNFTSNKNNQYIVLNKPANGGF